MKKLLIAVCLVLACAVTGSARQVFNLAALGLGPIVPFAVELDANPTTTEWMTTAHGQFWVIHPNGCKAAVTTPLPWLPNNFAALYVATIQKVGGIDHVVVTDTDHSDGVAPFGVYRIIQPCY